MCLMNMIPDIPAWLILNECDTETTMSVQPETTLADDQPNSQFRHFHETGRIP